jgi:UDP-N-acetylmuramate: L-alanyl-gamma-D-glutamyl-meso-diaminopimelate ligase
MGICGTAMAALAGMLMQRGYQVTGSDQRVYPPMSLFLEQLGIRLFSGYHPANLDHRPDLVIVGNVIPKKNPEAQALAELGIPYLSMPQAIASFFLSDHSSIVLTGTHGKTTTSAMLASALYHAGSDPSFMIGGVVLDFNSNHRHGKGPDFIVEGDEYDTAFFDKESKFLHYQPQVAVVTSVEFDHADIFTDLEAVKRSFRKFVALLPPDGLLVVHGNDPIASEIASQANCRIIRYGTSDDCDWIVANITSSPEFTSFDLLRDGETWRRIKIALPGLHNCLNAAAVAIIMHHRRVEPALIASGLAKFQGVKRRQEIRGVVRGITVIDDFAHHPTAVSETLQALKSAYSDNRLIAVFEPRSNTSRRSTFQARYAQSFDSADITLVREPASDKPIDSRDSFSAHKLAADLSESGKHAQPFSDTDQIISYLVQKSRPGDVIAILSNGGFDNIHARLLKELEQHD